MLDSSPNIEHPALHYSGPQAKGLDMLLLPLGILLYPVAANPERSQIQVVHLPPTPPHLLENLNFGIFILHHGAGKVRRIELSSGVAIVHTLELWKWQRRTVPALSKLTGGGHTEAVFDPVGHFLHAVQVCAGLRALTRGRGERLGKQWEDNDRPLGSHCLLQPRGAASVFVVDNL